jgi:hypothetical protein
MYLYFRKAKAVNIRIITSLISHMNNKITGSEIKPSKSMQIHQLPANYNNLYSEPKTHTVLVEITNTMH